MQPGRRGGKLEIFSSSVWPGEAPGQPEGWLQEPPRKGGGGARGGAARRGGQNCTGARSLSRPEVLCCQAGAVMELGRARKR